MPHRRFIYTDFGQYKVCSLELSLNSSVGWTTNDVADPNAARNNEVLFCLSQLFPSVHVSEIQKVVDVLARGEVGIQNDNFDLLSWINQSEANLSFPTAIQNPLQSEQALGYSNEINDHPTQEIIHHHPIEPPHLDDMMFLRRGIRTNPSQICWLIPQFRKSA